MLLKSVEYVRPDTAEQALEILRSQEGAAPLAGGQSLISILKQRVGSVGVLVDISALDELRTIKRGADGSLEIGACVTYDELDKSAEVRAGHVLVSEVASQIEDQQIRNRGTIGGNCCLGDPTNNLPPLLVALGATMRIRSARGSRELPAEKFFTGFFMTALEPGELLTNVSIPALAAGEGVGYSSLDTAAQSKTIVRAAALVRANGVIEEARVVLARVGPMPIRHRGMEDALKGSSPTESAVRKAAETIGNELDAISDSHGDANYRREMAKVVASRAVLEAIGKRGRSS